MLKNLDLNLEKTIKFGGQEIHCAKFVGSQHIANDAEMLADLLITINEDTGIVHRDVLIEKPMLAYCVMDNYTDADLSKYCDEEGFVDFFAVYDDYLALSGSGSGADNVFGIVMKLECAYNLAVAQKKDELLQTMNVGVQIANLSKELAKVGNVDLGVIRGILSGLMIQKNKPSQNGTVSTTPAVVDLSAFKAKV